MIYAIVCGPHYSGLYNVDGAALLVFVFLVGFTYLFVRWAGLTPAREEQEQSDSAQRLEGWGNNVLGLPVAEPEVLNKPAVQKMNVLRVVFRVAAGTFALWWCVLGFNYVAETVEKQLDSMVIFNGAPMRIAIQPVSEVQDVQAVSSEQTFRLPTLEDYEPDLSESSYFKEWYAKRNRKKDRWSFLYYDSRPTISQGKLSDVSESDRVQQQAHKLFTELLR